MNRLSGRASRKLEHLQQALELGDGPEQSGLEDVQLVHQALPELNWEDIDTSKGWLGKALSQPLLFNAMTGGIPRGGELNAALARVACRTGVGMAVGSQKAALDDPGVAETFRVARRENPRGLLLANISAAQPWEEGLRAVEMLEADGLQLHLNVSQELAMLEGERSFRGLLENIALLVERCPVPVLVKETGSGVSREAAFQLYGAGVRWVDVGGRGGTNFVVIEERRAGSVSSLQGWGISTAASILEVASAGLPLGIVATGGLRSGLDLAKVLALGAEVAGAAGIFLKVLAEKGEEGLCALLDGWRMDLRKALLLSGARTPREMALKPVLVTGPTAEWLKRRGLDPGGYARR